jgi:hypothetical protein
MTHLRIGTRYTRDQIHGALAGSIQEYLPHVGGQVVCGCFDPSKNPLAPSVILPGSGPGIRRWAEVFAGQTHFVPVFLKRATNSWEYVGDFRVRRRSVDPAEVADHARSSGRPTIPQVLHLDLAS